MRIEVSESGFLALRDEHHAEESAALVNKNRAWLAPLFPWVLDFTNAADALRSIRQHKEQASEGKSLNLGYWQEGNLCGMVGFVHLDMAKHRGSLGYWLDRDCQGKGWMNQACKALLAYGFDSLHLKEVHAECLPHNHPSRQVLEALGFSLLHVTGGAEPSAEGRIPFIRFKLSKEKWLAQNA